VIFRQINNQSVFASGLKFHFHPRLRIKKVFFLHLALNIVCLKLYVHYHHLYEGSVIFLLPVTQQLKVNKNLINGSKYREAIHIFGKLSDMCTPTIFIIEQFTWIQSKHKFNFNPMVIVKSTLLNY
jgi:hypothetical protein